MNHKIVGYKIIEEKGKEYLAIYTIKSIEEPRWILKEMINLDFLKMGEIPFHNLDSCIRFIIG
nr:MAG: hypothetical protein [uncultured archaeon]